MPSYVITEKCDGCKGQDKTACMYICPNDLMMLDKDGSLIGKEMKAYNQEPDYCWECYCCVKICPQQAMDVRGYADFMPLGAASTPLRGSEDIMWTITFRDGRIKRFKYPIRTTPEGSIKPFEGFPEANPDDLDNQLLFSEPQMLGVDELPKLQ
ncbi:MAG TPA: adenylyl-sulfate reductase subunit beta [Desulfobacterales bacterium]|nr:adenylyl-sulfate reductase subunit beta [Desulfobacterales bacterium]